MTLWSAPSLTVRMWVSAALSSVTAVTNSAVSPPARVPAVRRLSSATVLVSCSEERSESSVPSQA